MTQRGTVGEAVPFRQGSAGENLDPASPLSKSWWTDWGRPSDSSNIKLIVSANSSVTYIRRATGPPPLSSSKTSPPLQREAPIKWLLPSPSNGSHQSAFCLCGCTSSGCYLYMGSCDVYPLGLASFLQHSAFAVNLCGSRCQGFTPFYG